jgi:hypothetical protein
VREEYLFLPELDLDVEGCALVVEVGLPELD